jgi:Na+-driven multidrug efflux pump
MSVSHWLAGAAWATLAAQYISAVVFFVVLKRRRMLPLKWMDWQGLTLVPFQLNLSRF